MTTRDKHGRTYPDAIERLKGRVSRWRIRFRADCLRANASDRQAQRDIMRVRESRRRLDIAEAALSAAKEMG